MDLAGIDLVIFDKDGTLIDFHAMWGGWARELGTRLEAAARRPVAPDVFAAIGFDPSTGRVAAGGPLAAATMAADRGGRGHGPAALVPKRRRSATGDGDGVVRPGSGRARQAPGRPPRPLRGAA